MKKSLLLGLGAVAMAFAAGAGIVSGSGNGPLAEVHAEESQNSNLYIKGVLGGTDHWSTPTQLYTDSEKPLVAGYITFSLKAGDIFRFTSLSGYETDRGWSQLSAASSAYASFYSQGSDNNIGVKLGGNYIFSIDTSKNITVSIANETFSYVITTTGDRYNCAYLYNSDSDKFSEWASTPSVGSLHGGQAFDAKFVYSGNTYYGLYRISDHYLKNYKYLILKADFDVSGKYSNQSATITLNAAGEKLYYALNGDPENEYEGEATGNLGNATNEYIAAEFLYDLVINRDGSKTYSYDGTNFNFSICDTSPEIAGSLVTRYDNFPSSVIGVLNNAGLYTYDVTSKPYGEGIKAWATVEEMVDAMRIIASKSTASNVSAFVQNETNNVVVVSVLAGAIVLAAVNGLFLIRRKER